jgi:hypothetical protein
LAAGLALAATSTTHAQTECQFVLGFKTLRDLIGHHIVGQCLENEHYNAIGDSVQQTTGGLLVWRKADNWTAFTDGYRTWINGPQGLQQRLNTQRFEWEADYAPGGGVAAPTTGPPPTPVPSPSSSPSPQPPTPPTIDPTLGYALQVMRTTPLGEEAFQWYVTFGVSATFKDAEGAAFAYSRDSGRISIIVHEVFRNESADVQASLLVAAYAVISDIGPAVEAQTVGECFERLEAAYSVRAQWWQQKFGEGAKSDPATYWELQENIRMAQHRAGTLGNRLRRLDLNRKFCSQFGDLPPKPTASLGPILGQAFQVMRTTPFGEHMYREYLRTGAGATFATVRDAHALYLPAEIELVVSGGFRNQSYELIVLNLIHEIIHAVGDIDRGYSEYSTAEECYQEEIDAQVAETKWWEEKFGRDGKVDFKNRQEQVENWRLWHRRNGTLDDWIRSIESVQLRCDRYG